MFNNKYNYIHHQSYFYVVLNAVVFNFVLLKATHVRYFRLKILKISKNAINVKKIISFWATHLITLSNSMLQSSLLLSITTLACKLASLASLDKI